MCRHLSGVVSHLTLNIEEELLARVGEIILPLLPRGEEGRRGGVHRQLKAALTPITLLPKPKPKVKHFRVVTCP